VSVLVETTGLGKQYLVGRQPIEALKDFNVRIERGEFVAIVGPSGSGKSTCMHLLGCLHAPTSGSYRLDGEEVTTLGPDALAEIRNARIGFVFQAFHLQPRMSARRNVELPLVYADIPNHERRERAQCALESVGLAARADHRPAQLSGGEMQRVAIARALVNEPDLLLTDEPTGSLDSQTGGEVLALLSELNASGMTVLVVTHDMDVAAKARRMLHLRDGVVVADDSLAERAP
jgi:ABC-type lipoprotein export system ATPase subunit